MVLSMADENHSNVNWLRPACILWSVILWVWLGGFLLHRVLAGTVAWERIALEHPKWLTHV